MELVEEPRKTPLVGVFFFFLDVRRQPTAQVARAPLRSSRQRGSPCLPASQSQPSPGVHPPRWGLIVRGWTQGASYRPSPGSFDEMIDSEGQVRPGWERFLEALQSLEEPQLKRRWEQVRQLIRENGVTFNAYGADHGMDRPWQLDPFPLLMHRSEWDAIEAGLQQRAQLLELLLEDVYGEQRCVREGWLPPELVYGHPGYLRPCHGLPIPPECRLLLHAVDLARSSEGRLMVLRDRTESPSGCGYALENRLALARMMPEILDLTGVEKLAVFFTSLRETLAEMAERVFSTPRVVLLTPGPANQTYFEHAYLAQYLGYSLVQGDDLTVRDNRVYLKLLEGLQPVDVILRRLRDPFCDPLELRTDSVIGVPGLVQAVRAGNVVVANSLGSGWLESPALQAYLPRLSQALLGEELRLPSVPTWWCGQPESLDYVLANLPSLVLKPTFPGGTERAIFLQDLSRQAQHHWASELRRRPEAYVAQSQMRLSTAPALHGQGLEPRRVVLRAFLTRRGERFVVMPGALTLVTQQENDLVATLGGGAQSKDTWVLAPTSEEPIWLSSPAERPDIPLSRGGGDIPSRSADHLFWLGRYLERAETLTRLLRCSLVRLDEQSRPGTPWETPLLLDLPTLPAWPHGVVDRAACRTRILTWLTDPDQPAGLRPIGEHLQRLANSVRDRISDEGWRVLNHLLAISRRLPRTLREAQSELEEQMMVLSSFSGLMAENMTRGHGWRFLDLGRRIERAIGMVGLLRRGLSLQRPYEHAILEALLEIADATRTYRRRYPAGLQAAPVLDLLLADQSNPRSVAYQLIWLEQHLGHLPGHSPLGLPNPEERLLMLSLSRVQLADIHDLLLVAEEQRRPALQHLFRELGRELPLLSDLLSRKYLSHLALSSQQPGFGRETLP